uniref:Putative ovule protein n=1 Tax=Solanum chacoense TaxID=4108 RepID=A0A0V0IB14_SOLCH
MVGEHVTESIHDYFVFQESVKPTTSILFETDPLPSKKGKELFNQSHALHKRRKREKIGTANIFPIAFLG